MLVVAAADRFRGTASAVDVAAAIASAAEAAGAECDTAPVADGGEGTLEALGGAPARPRSGARSATRSSPSGGSRPTRPRWSRWPGRRASLSPAARRTTTGYGPRPPALGVDRRRPGRPHRPEPPPATPRRHRAPRRLRRRHRFVDAAEVFAPQKGAKPAQVALLRRRLERLAQIYVRDYGVDVTDLPGSGSAGGLAGGLAAAAVMLLPGFDLVADALGLPERIAAADLVVTGERTVDAESFEGKAVGAVVDLAADANVPVLVVAGDVVTEEVPELPPSVTVVSLVARFGHERP